MRRQRGARVVSWAIHVVVASPTEKRNMVEDD